MLHMDQHYAMTLGRPLGIPGIGDCPPPTPLTTNSTVLRLSTYINQFTVLARQILSADELDNSRIDDFSDRLVQLLDTLPAVIQFDESWLDQAKEVPDWPLDAHATTFFSKTHNYLILLNRQRQENSEWDLCQPQPGQIQGFPEHDIRSHDRKGYSRVLKSCRELLKAFAFFKLRVRPALMCWTIGQQAFNAAMILTLSMVETGSTADWSTVAAAYYTFAEMRDKGIHRLAKLACERLMELFKNLKEVDSKERVMGPNGMILLEDPGLQGFIPEKYGPVTFQLAGTDIVIPLESGSGLAFDTPAEPAPKRRRSNHYGRAESALNAHDDKEEHSPCKSLSFLSRYRGIGTPIHDMTGAGFHHNTFDPDVHVKGYSESIASSSTQVGGRSTSTSHCGKGFAESFGTMSQQWS